MTKKSAFAVGIALGAIVVDLAHLAAQAKPKVKVIATDGMCKPECVCQCGQFGCSCHYRWWGGFTR
jgi:hypothetical protein